MRFVTLTPAWALLGLSRFQARPLGESVAPLPAGRAGPAPAAGDGAGTVWVLGFGRSGTTLVEDILVHAAEARDGPVFAVFEPCHPDDEFRGRTLGSEDTPAMLECMRSVFRCDFAELTMHGDADARTRLNYVGLGQELGAACRAAETRVFKTIYPMPTELAVLAPALPPGGKILRVVRDPRSIYHSMLHTRGFPKYSASFPALLCATMGRWAAEESPVLQQVIYEDLVRFPSLGVEQILDFLAWPQSESLAAWLRLNLGAEACGSSVEHVLQEKLRAFRAEGSNNVTAGPLRYGQCKTKQDIGRTLRASTLLDAKERRLFKSGTCNAALWAYSYDSERPRVAALSNGTAAVPPKVRRLRPPKGPPGPQRGGRPAPRLSLRRKPS